MAPEIEIRSFRPEDAEVFRRLNEEWISQYFGLEPHDRVMLGRPQEEIIDRGGRIMIVTADDAPIGCVALVPLGEGRYELAKMAISPSFRGQGVGRLLLHYAIEQARELGARSLRLGSNTRLANAVHLYESVGFKHLPPERITPSKYKRTNVFMELPLD